MMADTRKKSRTWDPTRSMRSLSPARPFKYPTFPPPGPTGQHETYASSSIIAKTSFAERTRVIDRLRWHLHELDPTREAPARSLDRTKTLDAAGSDWLSEKGPSPGPPDRCAALDQRTGG
jgi:transposase